MTLTVKLRSSTRGITHMQNGSNQSYETQHMYHRRDAMALHKYKVGILMFDGVELLDFAGPYEVFCRTRLTPGLEARRSDESAPFDVFTVAKSAQPVASTVHLKIIPQYSFATAPSIDLLIVPG